MRTPDIIDPGSFIDSGRLDDKRGIVLPLADRIAVPSWLRNILRGKPSPVRPDAAKCPIILIKDQHLLFSLKDLYRSEVKEFYARKPDWIADIKWIVIERDENLGGSKSRLMRSPCFFPQRCERQFMLGFFRLMGIPSRPCGLLRLFPSF